MSYYQQCDECEYVAEGSTPVAAVADLYEHLEAAHPRLVAAEKEIELQWVKGTYNGVYTELRDGEPWMLTNTGECDE